MNPPVFLTFCVYHPITITCLCGQWILEHFKSFSVVIFVFLDELIVYVYIYLLFPTTVFPLSPCLPGKSLVRASGGPGRRLAHRWGRPLQGPDQDTLRPVLPVCLLLATPSPPCPWSAGEERRDELPSTHQFTKCWERKLNTNFVSVIYKGIILTSLMLESAVKIQINWASVECLLVTELKPLVSEMISRLTENTWKPCW